MQTVLNAERYKRRKRKDFSSMPEVISIPDLISVQKNSFEKFLQCPNMLSKGRKSDLEGLLQEVFPISNLNGTASLEYLGYEIGHWFCGCGEYKELGSLDVVCDKCHKVVKYKEKISIDECRQKSATYASSFKIKVRLVLYEKERVNCMSDESGDLIGKTLGESIIKPKTKSNLFVLGTKITRDVLSVLKKHEIREIIIKSVRDIKEQKVYIGEIPLMTERGTFIVNGTERVIASQLHRSPGAFFSHDNGKTHSSGKILYSARIIPYRGSWIDFEFDVKDILHIRIDRKRKFPATIILRALGLSTEEILKSFYKIETVKYDSGKDEFLMKTSSLLIGMRVKEDILAGKENEVIVKAFKKVTKNAVKKIKRLDKPKWVAIDSEDLIGKVIAEDIVAKKTGEVLLGVNSIIQESLLLAITQNELKEFSILHIDELSIDFSLRDTIALEKAPTPEDALREIYKRLRPGEPPTVEISRNLFKSLFFDRKRYDLAEVGRLKLNEKLNLDFPLSTRVLTKEDIVSVVRYLLNLRLGKGSIDDIDHLGNRRVRSVGESLEIQFRIGLIRMERAITERMSIQDIEELMPHDIINFKPITAAIHEFFGSSQLSQFMDQTNPLSEITHKRRLSALGPGGLTRERAGFEVRDVHPSHYGRICPIETPEGPNIGLIASLSTYARINKYGFIETPYRKVSNGVVAGDIHFLNAVQEEKYKIAQCKAPLDKANRFINKFVPARHQDNLMLIPAKDIDYMDVSPKQLISVAASLIPFLEHDDANRALMGSNMQRQAVPLLKTEAPLVGTATEGIVARDSGAVVLAKTSGEVISADASKIMVRNKIDEKKEGHNGSAVQIYYLRKFQPSNQNTCINQKPIVSPGMKIKKGSIIADGPATDLGELSLGRNILVAFMPWNGYNFEDAIVISEKLVKTDAYTSIHIEEFEVEARDTKQGKEEITRDIPNIGEETLKNLDNSGIIRIGARVKPDDTLVGKITPKGETQLSPEEKLLKAIFGEKAGDVKDTSLRVPPGVEGIVIDVKVFSRKGIDKDTRSLTIEEQEIKRIEKDYSDEINIVKLEGNKKIKSLLCGKTSANQVLSSKSHKVVIPKNKKISEAMLALLNDEELVKIKILNSDSTQDEIIAIHEMVKDQIHALKTVMNENIAKLRKGDELAPGVIKLVKVSIAMKRKLSVGDKMAGRHGNKGIVSIIVPEEDMPFTEDGVPIELILSPLGVPSRMNVGQILETTLGLAAKKLNIHMATPVFDGASEDDISKELEKAGIANNGKMKLFDGMTGKAFDQEVLVGQIYLMKLHHLVDDKIHARSTGPYSLVTQQPLGGKAQFGGQRLGEMEVWALEGYGAANILQEMLTVKSDDVEGRKRMYESIVKGKNILDPGLPESFNVMVKELQSLAIDVELMEKEKKQL